MALKLEGFNLFVDKESSTISCPCGASFTWSGGSDDLKPWMDKHELHLMAVIAKETSVRFSAVISEKMIREAFSIPKGAKVFIKIPSGGDYSGMDLDVEEILVTWTEKA